jgi:hypothetical protein
MPKSYRVRTEVGVDKYINVNLEQDWESLEVLSMKILANDVYTRMCSDYGVVVGRVFVNNGFGLPNARVSVFVPLDEADLANPVISELYPYRTITDTNEEGYRYNLLPKLPSYDGHQSTGSFPNISDVLMDESYIEVYDKYYRFTVKTNESGDFMIFGVPVGNQTIVMDIDLSDIGCFSLSPQDLIQQGLATESQVNGSRFKSSTNLRELPQIKNLVFDVDVSPFWGDDDLCQVGITRVDFDLSKQANVRLQPSSVFMGSIISNTDDDALKISCKPKNNTGNLCELIAGPGEIQAIRQTINSDDQGLPILELYEFDEGGKVIDPDGAFLVNVPMNLDYVFTNEFGEQVLSNDPSKGIPTKGKYRFRFRWQNEEGLQNSFQRANFLVPNVKEYGWTSSGTDPIDNLTNTYTYTLNAGVISGSTVNFANAQGFGDPETNGNIESYIIYINGSPYIGTLNSIEINPGDTFQIVANPVDNTQPQEVTFKTYPGPLFDLYRSYAFSTDWDDYVNPQEAIDCEDTFYEFQYNKVYTTAMFLDRYKNGFGRAKHLGIKEIDNRSCKSTVNTFPVNDIIRNFDPIFFVFNILINILTFPILVILFVAHLIALLWPVLKYLLLFLGPYIVYQGVSSAVDLVYYITSLGDFAPIGGPVISIGTILQIIAQAIKSLALIAAGVVFTAFYTNFLIDSLNDGKVDNFPRIGLPMISYSDCTSCDCQCGNASLDDDFDENTIQAEIQAAQNDLDSPAGGLSYELTVSQPNSVIAPVNSPGSYAIQHPNLLQDDDQNDPFNCPGPGGYFKTLQTLIGNDDITSEVGIRAALDFTRMISGYDVLSSTDPNKYINPETYLLHAPQPFLWSAKKETAGIPDWRFFAYPNSVTFSQKLNEFNTRDKYFNNAGGINQIRTTVNPTSGSTPFLDQVVVVLMNSGTAGSIGVGNLCLFQDPNFIQTGDDRLKNLTGATFNQFSNNAVTGTTITGQTSVQVTYANPATPTSGPSFATVVLDNPQVSQLPVLGNPNEEQAYLQYATDVEYFQLITGITVGEFYTIDSNTSGSFPVAYLGHDVGYQVPNCIGSFDQKFITNVITYMSNSENYEICVFVRGVDPFSPKQTIKYDLSKIFGYGTLNNTITVEGSYYLNVPIQPQSTGFKPASHNTITNNATNLYFPSYSFTIDPTQYSGFSSSLPYYYLSTDDSISSGYLPVPQPLWDTNAGSTNNQITTIVNGENLPNYLPPISNGTTYVVGGSYIRWSNGTNAPNGFPWFLTTAGSGAGCDQDCQKGQYYNTNSGSFLSAGGELTSVYSPAYYRQLTTPVNFSNSNRIVMRSDRLPTSTRTQNGGGTQTGFALHQNDNFAVYTANGVLSPPTITAGGDLPNGDSFDDDTTTGALTSTLSCEGMVPLACYSGSGVDVGVVPAGSCSVPENRMINGCYCLLNKKYVKEYRNDADLFLEWKVRFTMNFAACRGVFAQVFQNNWINGVLYMFNFNKALRFPQDSQKTPYAFCDNVVVFNDLTNNFYYRSSPWRESTQQFIGKNPPTQNPLIPSSFLEFPGFGYNEKQIQFPTTVVDLGPRDYFINQVCCSAGDSGFGSYYADQIKSSSYQDNADIIQLGFLSRILNQGVRQRILPITSGQNSTEGKGIEQFFNSTRGGYRIDGDWAQMLSINSEWKVSPFITENLPSDPANNIDPNDYIFFGDNYYPATAPSNSEDVKPVMGLFFQTTEEGLRYRKIESPGIETYSYTPLIENDFGYPKSQVVPYYKWSIRAGDGPGVNIFGSEDNNWYTDSGYQTGFFYKKYQDLDFVTNEEKYKTSTVQLGYISNVDSTGKPTPNVVGVNHGQPINSNIKTEAIVVGAPYHFYFGLNNGKTALDRFYKLYVATSEE